MPELGPKNIEEAFAAISGEKDSNAKFVRQESVVWWGPMTKEHLEIAREAQMTKPEDAGMLLAKEYDPTDRMLYTWGISMGITIRNAKKARSVTGVVIQEIVEGSDIKTHNL